jgi:pyruvate,water dikinase
MAMVDAVCGGVLYSVNPMDIRDQSVTINAVWGLPTAVVDGTTAADRFQVARSPALAVTAPGHCRQGTKICLPSGRRGVSPG